MAARKQRLGLIQINDGARLTIVLAIATRAPCGVWQLYRLPDQPLQIRSIISTAAAAMVATTPTIASAISRNSPSMRFVTPDNAHGLVGHRGDYGWVMR